MGMANRPRRSPTTRFRSEPIEPGSMVLSRSPRSWIATKGTAQIQLWGRVEAIPNDRRYEGSEEPSEVPGRSCILAISPASREPAALLPPRTCLPVATLPCPIAYTSRMTSTKFCIAKGFFGETDPSEGKLSPQKRDGLPCSLFLVTFPFWPEFPVEGTCQEVV